MLVKLRKAIKKTGVYQISYELGYRSPFTVNHWMKNKRIPDLAKPRLKEWLNANGF